jgi:hypothetical protein
MLWAASHAVLLLAWGLAYRWVFVHAPLAMPQTAEGEGGSHTGTWLFRYGEVLLWAARAAFSLPPTATPLDLPVVAALAAFGLVAVRLAVSGRDEVRARIRASLPGLAWGLVWFLLLAAPLVFFHPAWQPYRSVFAAVGLGTALTLLLGAISPGLTIALLVLRVALLVQAPGPALRVPARAERLGAFIDVPKMTRLQHLVARVHHELRANYPRLPRGAAVAQHNFPLMSELALDGSKALRVWYRDSTLRWVKVSRWYEGREPGVVTIAEYQNVPDDPIALIEPAALRHLFDAVEDIGASRWTQALARLDSAASLQPGTRARMFLGAVEAKRAVALAATDHTAEAEAVALRARTLNPLDPEVHTLLGILWCRQGRLGEAEAQLDTVKWLAPEDPGARRLFDEIEAARAQRRSSAGR